MDDVDRELIASLRERIRAWLGVRIEGGQGHRTDPDRHPADLVSIGCM
jgi:hypothetical protein